MQIIFLSPFIILPIISALKIKFSWRNYLALFITSFGMGGVIGYGIFKYMSLFGPQNLPALIIFYGFYIAFFICSFYSVATHFLKNKTPEVFLAINFGFLIISFAVISIYGAGSEDIFYFYSNYLKISILPHDVLTAIYEVLMIIGSGLIFGIIAFVLNIFAKAYK
jgi:hypothetical protein